jgi:zinc transport system ATP-binding protein
MKKKLFLNCNNISYKRNNNFILSDISFKLHAGEIITIIGPNGGGKSTLAKLIIGIIHPSHGRIIKKNDLKIGYMPQSINLNILVPITVKKFLSFYGNEIFSADNIEKILEISSVNNILHKQIYCLSGGELQRVLFARVLLRDPELMILDEPVQGLDVSGQKKFYSMIDQIRSEFKKSVIMISHDLHTVMSSSDNVMCLNKKVHCSGMPKEIKSDKLYQNLFSTAGTEVISTYTHTHQKK